MALDNAQLKTVLESVLFVAEGPVDLKTLARLAETTPEQVAYLLEQLAEDSRERGVRVQRTGDRAQLVSAPEAASSRSPRPRLSGSSRRTAITASRCLRHVT
jgi:chromosome segregation and condensation protein ScpB